jgi:hypothetical protein
MSQGGQEGGRLLAGRYRLASMLGRGGMGTVWRARDEVLERDVAVKEVIVAGGLSDADRDLLHQRTFREARATARLSHPNIVTVHDVIEENGRPWIVMEFVRARSLQDVIEQDGPLPPPRVAEVGRQMLSALRAAHGIGILHRDVKPSNVLLTDDDRAVLTDFGIAYVEGDAALTQTGLIIGSPSYISPERARGDRAGPGADLWALGATLYAACEGRPPHERTDPVSVLAAILTEDPPAPRNAGPLLPVLQGLLQRDPAQRMPAQTAAGLLMQIAAGTTVPAAVPAGTTVQAPAPGQGGAARAGTLHFPHDRPAPPPPDQRANGTPAGPPPRRSGKGAPTGLIVTVSVLATAVVVLAGFLLVKSLDGDGGTPTARKTTAPAQQGANANGGANGQDGATGGAGAGGGSSAPPTTQQPAPPRLPAGWVQASEPGYTIGVPAGWRRSVRGQSVFWRDPNSAAYLQVDRTPWTGPPVEAWQQWESEVLDKGTLDDYHRIDLRQVNDTYYQAADIEFTWAGQGDRLMHGVDRHAIAGGRYAVFVAVPADQWDASRQTVTGFLDTFRP